jgi:hypothetical protein
MPAIIKKKMERRMKVLINRFGSLEKMESPEQQARIPEANRLAWTYLLEGGSELGANLASINPQAAGPVGPLLQTRWHQRPPYNDLCPGGRCSWPDQGNFNDRALVGCGQLALAQVMRYYSWPPYSYSGLNPPRFYEWPKMSNQYIWDESSNWFNDENGNSVTPDQIYAVAALCIDAGEHLYVYKQECDGTTHALCHWWVADLRDALEDHFFYSNPDDDQQFPDAI